LSFFRLKRALNQRKDKNSAQLAQ